MRNAFCVIMMNTTIVEIYDFHTNCPTIIYCHTHLSLDHTHFQDVPVNAIKNLWYADDILCSPGVFLRSAIADIYFFKKEAYPNKLYIIC